MEMSGDTCCGGRRDNYRKGFLGVGSDDYVAEL